MADIYTGVPSNEFEMPGGVAVERRWWQRRRPPTSGITTLRVARRGDLGGIGRKSVLAGRVISGPIPLKMSMCARRHLALARKRRSHARSCRRRLSGIVVTPHVGWLHISCVCSADPHADQRRRIIPFSAAILDVCKGQEKGNPRSCVQDSPRRDRTKCSIFCDSIGIAPPAAAGMRRSEIGGS